MASNALVRFPRHNHDLALLNDVDNSAKSDGKTLVWNELLGKHVYVLGGTGNSFDVDTIVTGSLLIPGLNDPNYTGDQVGLVIVDDDGNVVTT